MKLMIKIFIFSLFNFFCMRAMDQPCSTILSDQHVQNLVTTINKSSLNIVHLIKEKAAQQDTPMTPQNIRSLLHLSQEHINELFLNNINNPAMFNTMLEMGADINAHNHNKENCLFYTSDIKILKTLIDQGADVHCLSASHKTPLTHHCNFNIQPDLLALFLEAGAHPNAMEDENIHSLLAQAIMKKCALSVKLLCKHKAHVNPSSDMHVTTPLMLAIVNNDNNNKARYYEIIETLLESGAIADCHDNITDDRYDRYPLHHATGWPNFSTFNEKIIFLLLKYKANPNRAYPFTDGKNYPLHQAVIFKHLAVITALLQHGARTDYRNKEGLTPLGLAQSLRCPDNIITLLAEYTIITEDDNPRHNKHTTKKNISSATSHDEPKSEKCSIQ